MANENSVILEEEIDENYEPTQEDILEYAKWLGMELPAETELLWIAREGLKAPLPDNWKPCRTDEDEIYYFNFSTGQSVWDHPCDDYYKYARPLPARPLTHPSVRLPRDITPHLPSASVRPLSVRLPACLSQSS
eukprot:jgi/Mesen1/5687/ME000288S04902